MNPDFRDMLRALSEEKAEFLVVGAYALAAYGFPRATGDIDIWVRPSKENAPRVLAAITRFGAPLMDLTRTDLETPGTVFQIGVEPTRIDLMTSIDGVTFDEAWPSRIHKERDGLSVPFVGKADYLRNKRAVGRPKDLADVDTVESGGASTDTPK